jgi:hypothetical protein
VGHGAFGAVAPAAGDDRAHTGHSAHEG